jgi:UDP-3-O-[3-hydroxymyristoyl] glucosamine N-acyltransferase
VGAVVIGDDVEVGANTCIDRGALDDTVIEDGVKLDNLIQIGHNCRIGAHTVIAGCTGISGSTTVGRNCMIGGGVGLVGHIAICDDVTLTGMTFVTKSITRPGTYSSGLPSMPHAEWLRNAAHLRRLDALAARLARSQGEDRERNDD